MRFSESLQNLFSNVRRKYRSFHVAQNSDPIARKTSWTPLKNGGSNFCTRKLICISPTRYEFRASAGAILFYALFMAVGAIITAGTLYYIFFVTLEPFSIRMLTPATMGCLFFIIGISLLISGSCPIVLDRAQNACWKGRKEPKDQFSVSIRESIPLESVYALQLLPERCHNEDHKTYYSYELNLILHDGQRFNLVDHGNLSIIREQAMTLADFLHCPLWDAVYLTNHYQPERTEFTIS